MGAVDYKRSGCPDIDARTSRFELLSHLFRSSGSSGTIPLATEAFKTVWKHRGSGSGEESVVSRLSAQGCVETLQSPSRLFSSSIGPVV